MFTEGPNKEKFMDKYRTAELHSMVSNYLESFYVLNGVGTQIEDRYSFLCRWKGIDPLHQITEAKTLEIIKEIEREVLFEARKGKRA